MDKTSLLKIISEKLSEKIQTLQTLIEETRTSNNDTKSSMGDKYETGREMLQQEINNLQIQLNGFSSSLNILKNINPVPHQSIGLGSLVETEKGKFFISVSLGEVSLDGEKIFVISTESPLAKAMHGKKAGETLIVNDVTQTLKNIW
ncbi:hypothetical protein [Chryseobacterium sp. R2A-55]|uniref:hypothetical protein n=1 Tax=Chryseobacterium sp. R2A-55 TaxID=2744445 RepID=UPI001F1AA8DC|nr:hypothetical protein [Chryseobacterium sp. R2A-55]